MVTGGRQVNTDLLEHKFDYIFFTGGKQVGQLVMEKASRHLTPVTLELGGKSPCIVDETAKLPLAAKRIVFGKYLNLGQTCVGSGLHSGTGKRQGHSDSLSSAGNTQSVWRESSGQPELWPYYQSEALRPPVKMLMG